MPQRPKSFRIDSVAVRPDPQAAPVRTGPGTAAPGVFVADVHLAVPDIHLKLGIRITAGGLPVVQALTVWASDQTPLTSGTLRKILLDPIVRAAAGEAARQVRDRSDVAPGAFHVDGAAEDELWVTAPAGATERVQQIARLYNDALMTGRPPGLEAANAVHISRAQAARYIRKARELGLIPPVGEVTGVVRPPAVWPVRVDPVGAPQAGQRREAPIFRPVRRETGDSEGN